MSGINDMSDTLSRKVDDASDSVQQAIASASGAIRPATEHFAAGVHHAIDSMTKAANEALATLEHKGGQIKDMESHLVDSCGNYVRQKPITSLGIAVATGFLLSWLVRSR